MDFGLLVLGFPGVGLRSVRQLPWSWTTWFDYCKAKLIAAAHKDTECYTGKQGDKKAEDGVKEKGVHS